MTGPEHYREGEKLLVKARGVSMGDGYAQHLVSVAQAHFTAALAAATAVGTQGIGEMPISDADAWAAAASTPPPSDVEGAATPERGDGRG